MSRLLLSDTFNIIGYELMYFTSDTVEVVDPNITIAYTSNQRQYRVVNDEKLLTTSSYNAYNRRGKLVMSMTATGSGGKDDLVGGVTNPDPLTLQMSFYVWSYDFYSNFQADTITPPQLGVSKDVFGFEDALIAEYSVNFAAASDYEGQKIYELTDIKIKMHHYDSYGRRYEDQEAELSGGPLSAGFWVSKSVVDNLFATLEAMDISTSVASLSPITIKNVATTYLKLNISIKYFLTKYSITFSGGDISQSSHKVGKTRYTNNATAGNYPNFQQMETDYSIVYQPLERLPRVSSFNIGNYQKVPLGSTPSECACRMLGLTFNNIYALSGSPDIGVVQIISAIEQDVVFIFYSEQPSFNYEDLSALYSSVQGFSYARASYIAKVLGLTYHWVPYISTVVDALDFDSSLPFLDGTTLLPIGNYPYIGLISGKMDDALRHVIENFVIVDFGINDTVDNVVTLYNLYKSYKFGIFYTISNGENLRKLGAVSSISSVQEWHKNFTKILFAEKLDYAYNSLMRQLHAISGRLKLLDLRKLPIPVGSYVQVEVLENYSNTNPIPPTSMISDVGILIDSSGNFDVDISFTGKTSRA